MTCSNATYTVSSDGDADWSVVARGAASRRGNVYPEAHVSVKSPHSRTVPPAEASAASVPTVSGAPDWAGAVCGAALST